LGGMERESFLSARFARVLPLAAALAAALGLGGCASLQPQPLTAQEIAQVSAADRQQAQDGVEPLQGPLTLDEAIARAIKHNLQRRTRLMEVAVAQGQLDVGRYDMLPKLLASAGYRDRNNDLITRSIDSVTGQPSLSNPFISTDRSALATDLSFTWSLLDFGQSYYASKQNADRALIAAERSRRALHTLVQDVRTAFWRTAVSQKLRDGVQATIASAEDALQDSKKAEAERLRNPLDALRYRRQLLDNLRLLETIQQELSTAQVELATLTNLPLAQKVVVVEPAEDVAAGFEQMPVEQMEEHAIAHNAELRESFYTARIARIETRRVMARLFPGLSFSYAAKHSDDSFLINHDWTEAGAQISFNLLGLLQAPAQRRLAEAGVALADQQRMTTQMALLAQVHIARLQFLHALRQLDRADAIAQVDSDIATHMSHREQAQTQTKLDRVAHQTAAILSQLRRYQALAQMHAAAGKLQATLGLEPAIKGDDAIASGAVTQAVSASLQAVDAGDATQAQ
jgi:outer membrane protein TolC